MFLWESYELAEEGDLTATLAQRRRDWGQRLLLVGIKQLLLSLAVFRGQGSVTVNGDFLWCVIAKPFGNPSKFGPGLIPFYYKATPAGTFDCEVGIGMGCGCPCWGEADALTAWFAPLRERDESRNEQAGNGSLTEAATVPLTLLFPSTRKPAGPRLVDLWNLLIHEGELRIPARPPQPRQFSSEPLV